MIHRVHLLRGMHFPVLVPFRIHPSLHTQPDVQGLKIHFRLTSIVMQILGHIGTQSTFSSFIKHTMKGVTIYKYSKLT